MNRRKLLQGILSLGLLKVVGVGKAQDEPWPNPEPSTLDSCWDGVTIPKGDPDIIAKGFDFIPEHWRLHDPTYPTRDDVRQFLASERFPNWCAPYMWAGGRTLHLSDEALAAIDRGETLSYEFS